MTVFYLIRHAHAEWTPDEQRPLSPQGRRDAQRAADLLSGFPITRVYSSPFRRAWETVSPLAARSDLSVHSESGLRERKLSGDPTKTGVGRLQAEPSHPVSCFRRFD